jgi:hypothetical protein
VPLPQVGSSTTWVSGSVTAAHVVELAPEVGLPLEDRAREQRVDPAAHARAVVLLLEVGGAHAEAVAQDLGEMGAHGLVAGPGREACGQLGQGVGAPGRGHRVWPEVMAGECARRNILWTSGDRASSAR